MEISNNSNKKIRRNKHNSKKDNILVITSIIGIILIIVLILNINNIFKTPDIDTSRINNKLASLNQSISDSSTPLTRISLSSNYAKCAKSYNISPDSIIFFHSNSCPHCAAMKPIVRSLESQGYNFFWAESSDSDAMKIMRKCFSELMSGYVPEFICSSNGKVHTGKLSEAELKNFAEKCSLN